MFGTCLLKQLLYLKLARLVALDSPCAGIVMIVREECTCELDSVASKAKKNSISTVLKETWTQ
jgi:hypothetical protein